MKVLNTEIEFNFNDADDMEKLENAIDEANCKLNSMNTEGRRTSKVIRETCKIIFDCFNKTFGEGMDKRVFGTKTSLDICINAFNDLCNARLEQERALQKEVQNIESKYSPNRAMRRTKKQ